MKGRKTVMLIRFFLFKTTSQCNNKASASNNSIYNNTHIFFFCIFLTKNEMEKWNLGKKLLCYIIYFSLSSIFPASKITKMIFSLLIFILSFFLSLAIELIIFIFHISEYILKRMKETL